MEDLAEGRAVNLVTDPTQGTVDSFGRSLFYVDRTDGVDVGLAMIRRGWSAAYIYDEPFQRLQAYLSAETDADAREAGV
jgi:endonuclease YncB( thermonuclease family)